MLVSAVTDLRCIYLCLLVFNLFVTLLTLAVFGCDSVAVVTVSTAVALQPAVTLPTAEALARDWIAAAGCGQVQVAMAITGLAGSSRYGGSAEVSVGTSRGRRTDMRNNGEYAIVFCLLYLTARENNSSASKQANRHTCCLPSAFCSL